MKKELPKVKRRSRQRFKELDMKEKQPKKKAEKKILKKTQKKAHANTNVKAVEKEPRYLEKQTLAQFKEKGLTLIKGKNGDKKISIKKTVIPVLAIAVVVIVIAIYFNAPTGLVEWVATKSALNKSGNGFPVSYDVSAGKDFTYSNGQLLVVNETDLRCFNKRGNKVYTRIHGFANPILKTSKMRNLIYGLGTSQYKIEAASKEIAIEKTSNKQAIICGDISDSGVYALATKSDEDVGLVTVYDKNSSEIYKYHSSTSYITGVTVSENGRMVCVTTLTAKNAEFVSKIIVLDLDKTKPVYEKSLNDELVYLAEYSDSKNICVLTDKRYLNVSQDETECIYDYNSDTLNKYEISDDYILLYTTADLNSTNGRVSVFSLKGTPKASFSVETGVADISAANGDVYILSDKVTKFDFDGEKQDTFKIKNGATKIKAFSSNVAVLYSSGIEEID